MTFIFLLIIGLSFFVMANSLTNTVSDYLFEQKISGDSASAAVLASKSAAWLQKADTDTLYRQLSISGSELGGRLLVIDKDGKVQVDTFSELNGTLLDLP